MAAAVADVVTIPAVVVEETAASAAREEVSGKVAGHSLTTADVPETGFRPFRMDSPFHASAAVAGQGIRTTTVVLPADAVAVSSSSDATRWSRISG
jgi:hypothetical protein